jgi:FAD binding domain-containing protein
MPGGSGGRACPRTLSGTRRWLPANVGDLRPCCHTAGRRTTEHSRARGGGRPMGRPAVSPDYDVLVIGSGFGGSVAALRLAEKGYRVGVLEAGRRFEDADFSCNSWDVRRSCGRRSSAASGIQRIHVLRNAIILAGAGVGGGSLVFANTLCQPTSDAFYGDRQWAHITGGLSWRRITTRRSACWAWSRTRR